MSNIPTPIKAVLGLAATAVDEAKKLPETLPQAATTVPMLVLSTAMQTSLRVQQRITELAIRGDAVISQLRGVSAEPPQWATFDDAPAEPASTSGKAAFDRIDYDNTGFDEGDERPGRWDAVGVGGTAETSSGTGPAGTDVPARIEIPPTPAKVPGKKAAAKKPAAKKLPGPKAPGTKAPGEPGPGERVPGKKVPGKKAPAKKAGPPHAEPLEVAAEKARPSDTPNPATMAAEIAHAHESAVE